MTNTLYLRHAQTSPSVAHAILRVALAGLVVAIGINQCCAQAPSPDVSGAAQASAFFANKTHVTSSSGHGTQIEYLRSGGAAFLWYPGNAQVVRGDWKIEAREPSDVLICFRYGSNTYNPVTNQSGGQWACGAAARQASRIVESAPGDVFRLAKRTAVPFVLAREPATIEELKTKLQSLIVPRH
jgi:hypothetical protein